MCVCAERRRNCRGNSKDCVCVCVCVCMHTCAHALNAEEIVRAIRATAQQSWGKQCVQVPRRAPFKVSPCLSLRHSHIS